MSGAITLAPDPVVTRWVDAFNERDLEGMLLCLHPAVRLHPLRLGGLNGSYHGHDGVRLWFERRVQLHHEHRIVLADVHAAGDGKVLVVGALRLAGNFDIAPFCALQAVAEGVIVAAHHYLTDPDMMERVGLVP